MTTILPNTAECDKCGGRLIYVPKFRYFACPVCNPNAFIKRARAEMKKVAVYEPITENKRAR